MSIKKIPGLKARELREYRLAEEPYKKSNPEKINKGIRRDRNREGSWGKRESWEAKG